MFGRLEFAEKTRQFHARAPVDPGTGDVTLQLNFLTPTTGPVNYDADLSGTRKLETRVKFLRARIAQVTEELVATEAHFGISRWQVTDAQYIETVKYIATRRYQRALGRLQRLVIQRLFELHRMNLARTGKSVARNYMELQLIMYVRTSIGYKARTHLAKSLQRRCRAIRAAVKEYNQAAAELDPAPPRVNWERVSHFSFLEQFSLLQARSDVVERPWARPEVRETMRLALRIDRAREEIVNVNREIRRLHTSIRDEEIHFRSTLAKLKSDNPQ